MSRAFVKELDGDEGEALPELRVSEHRNLVTPAGLGQIEANVEQLQAVLSAARAAEDRAAVARVQRDLRYWNARLRSAEVVPLPGAAEVVRFGSAVVLQDPSGRRIDYQVATPTLGALARCVDIYTAQRFSDHAPLTIDYDFTLAAG